MSSSDTLTLLQRTDHVLHALAVRRRQTLTELCETTGLPRTTVHRILEQLLELRWLSRHGNQYEFGTRIFEIGAGSTHWFRELARPELEALHHRTRLTVHLGFLELDTVLVWDKLPAENAWRMPTRLGGRVPAHASAMGKAILASSPHHHADRILTAKLRAVTPHTITDPNHFREELDRVRDDGLAQDHGELAPWLGCLAGAVIVQASGESIGASMLAAETTMGAPMVAAVSISGPSGVTHADPRLASALRQVCQNITVKAQQHVTHAYDVAY